MEQKNLFKIICIVILINIVLGVVNVLYCYNFIPHKKYSNDRFAITAVISSEDADNDGVDDQTDILNCAKDYVSTNPEKYDVEVPDKNIDFRRVKKLIVFLENNAVELTTDISEYEEWHGGDIVIFTNHIGIVSDTRNAKGIPFVIHNARPLQADYEEDILENWGEIVGHYRMSE